MADEENSDLKFGIQSDEHSQYSTITVYNPHGLFWNRESGRLRVQARLSFEEFFRLKKKIDAEALALAQKFPNLFKTLSA